jgi:hypothetical protein
MFNPTRKAKARKRKPAAQGRKRYGKDGPFPMAPATRQKKARKGKQAKKKG